MVTITINNTLVEEKYTNTELQKKFLFFIQQEIKEDKVELYEISVSDLSKKSQDRLENIEDLNFVNY